jgi:hypothetical protein
MCYIFKETEEETYCISGTSCQLCQQGRNVEIYNYEKWEMHNHEEYNFCLTYL